MRTMLDQTVMTFQEKKRQVPDDLARRAPVSANFRTVLKWRLSMIEKYGTSVPELFKGRD